jgi:hypothetical protein
MSPDPKSIDWTLRVVLGGWADGPKYKGNPNRAIGVPFIVLTGIATGSKYRLRVLGVLRVCRIGDVDTRGQSVVPQDLIYGAIR